MAGYEQAAPPIFSILDRDGYSTKGYAKAWRRVLNSDTFKNLTAAQRDVFWICILLANYEEHRWEWEGRPYRCKPGQFITSLKTLNELTARDVSTQMIRTALSKLEKWEFLTNESTKTGRLITICNWERWNDTNSETNKETNKALTKHQQSSNKALTTTKNSKKYKNIKKKKESAKKFVEEDLEFKMAKTAIQKIRLTFPDLDFSPSDVQKACGIFQQLMKIDGKTVDQIRDLLNWIPNAEVKPDGFSWKNQFQSPLALRKKKDGITKFDRMYSAMVAEKKKPKPYDGVVL